MGPAISATAASPEATGAATAVPPAGRVASWLVGLPPRLLSSLHVGFTYPRVYVSVHGWAPDDVAGVLRALEVPAARAEVRRFLDHAPAPYVSVTYGDWPVGPVEVTAFACVTSQAHAEQVLTALTALGGVGASAAVGMSAVAS